MILQMVPCLARQAQWPELSSWSHCRWPFRLHLKAISKSVQNPGGSNSWSVMVLVLVHNYRFSCCAYAREYVKCNVTTLLLKSFLMRIKKGSEVGNQQLNNDFNFVLCRNDSRQVHNTELQFCTRVHMLPHLPQQEVSTYIVKWVPFQQRKKRNMRSYKKVSWFRNENQDFRRNRASVTPQLWPETVATHSNGLSKKSIDIHRLYCHRWVTSAGRRKKN